MKQMMKQSIWMVVKVIAFFVLALAFGRIMVGLAQAL